MWFNYDFFNFVVIKEVIIIISFEFNSDMSIDIFFNII